MDVTWLNGTVPLSNSDHRVTVSSLSGSQLSFTSTLTLSPVSTFDNTNFTCRARARPLPQQNFITASEEGARTVSLTVKGKQFNCLKYTKIMFSLLLQLPCLLLTYSTQVV